MPRLLTGMLVIITALALLVLLAPLVLFYI